MSNATKVPMTVAIHRKAGDAPSWHLRYNGEATTWGSFPTFSAAFSAFRDSVPEGFDYRLAPTSEGTAVYEVYETSGGRR